MKLYGMIYMRRLFSRYYFFTSRCQKILIAAALCLFSSLLVWCFIGEVLVFKTYSIRWKWPTPRPDRPEDASKTVTIQPRSYHQDKDTWTHHYVPGSYKALSARDRRRVRRRKSQTADHYLKIMFISDPHIMCTNNIEEWWLAQQDADYYLQKSFSYIHPHLKPDLVIFLGDIFSHGFIAQSQQQWNNYVQCLKQIYPIFSSAEKEKLIVTMGDNDLGGEGLDKMTETVYRRYEETFGDLNVVFDITDDVRIIKITTTCFLRPPLTIAEAECRESLISFLETYPQEHTPKKAHSQAHLTFLLSHVPLNKLSKSIQFTHDGKSVDIRTKILLSLRPSVVVCGHDHHEGYTQHSMMEGLTAHEIMVPTCSYRMGEANMGIGTAVININGNLAYKVNWLPPRYPFIIGYVVLGVSFLFVCLCLAIRRR